MSVYQYKKGETGNPFGFLPVGEDIKNARKLTRTEFERLVNKYLYMSLKDIEIAVKDKNLTTIELMICSIVYKALTEGDDKRLNFLLDRTIGQSVKRIKVTTEQEDGPRRIPVDVSPEEKLEMLDRLRKRIMQEKEKQEKIIDVEQD